MNGLLYISHVKKQSFFKQANLFLAGYIILSENRNDTDFKKLNPDNPDFVLTQNRESINDEISNSRRNIITKTVELVSPSVIGINVIEIR